MSMAQLEIAQQWIEKLNRGRLEICRLYSDTATFHPTMSPRFVQTKEGVQEYFEVFLAKKPNATVVDYTIQDYGKTTFLYTGRMKISLEEDGNKSSILARFSFLWNLSEEGWKIEHHHNSVASG